MGSSKSQSNTNAYRSLPRELLRKFRAERVVTVNDAYVRYEAYDLKYFRPVTLTVLRNISKFHKARIVKALDVVSRIRHPNVLPILEHSYANGDRFYFWSTPRVESVTWKNEISTKQNISDLLDYICSLIADLLEGLDVAHRSHVFHGVINSSNIVRYNGRYCLSDFALPVSSPSPKQEDSKPVAISPFGTKVAAEKPPDVHTDLEGIGTSLIEILGTVDKNDSFGGPAQFPHLYEFIHRLLETNPDKRLKSAKEARSAFTEAVQADTKSLETQEVWNRVVERTEERLPAIRDDALGKLMPVLAKTLETIDTKLFKDVVVLHINHCVEDIFILNQVLCSLGATLVFVVIPYSNVSTPLPSLYSIYHASSTREGFQLYRNTEQLEHIAFNFDEAIGTLILGALRDDVMSSVKEQKKRLLVIEDGGYHYDSLDKIYGLGIDLEKCGIGVVEQTASGARRCARYIETRSLPYPVLTIARSDIKMRFEPYFVARRVAEEINDLLYQVNDFLPFHNVIVVGYGIIGRNIAFTLNEMNCNVFIIDTDPDACNLAQKEGYQVLSEIPVSVFEKRCIVIGATGESSFTHSMLIRFLESSASLLYLASASSKRIEFSDLIEFFEGNYDTRRRIISLNPVLGKIDNIEIEFSQIGLTYHFTYDKKNKSISMLARGFPVNFYRPRGISLTHRIIDPINTEIVLSAQHLVRFCCVLQNALYLVGDTPIPSFEINEENIMAQWMGLNELMQLKTRTSVWDNFRIHPLEDRLRTRFLY